MTKIITIIAIVLSLLCTIGNKSFAARKQRASDIKARSVSINQKTGMVVYRGNVRIRIDNIIIRANQIAIRVEKGKTRFMIAKGSPLTIRRLATETEKAFLVKAEKLEYKVKNKIMELRGNVSFHQDKNFITSDYLLYDNNREYFVARSIGDRKVTATFFPKSESTDQ
jgi:lipopolysaccharide export system protein LptA